MENTENNNNIYKNAKIYIITDNSYTEKYIGSTVQALSSRMSSHRRNYKAFKNGGYHFVSLYELVDKFGVENCKIELLAKNTMRNQRTVKKS